METSAGSASGADTQGSGEMSEAEMESLRAALFDRLKQDLRPEFLNRVDEIVVFRPLGREQIRHIVQIQFGRTKRMAERQGINLVLTDAAKDELAREGFDPVFGARPLKRVLQRQVANKLAEQILGGLVREGDTVVIDAEAGGGVSLSTVPAGEAVPAAPEASGDGASGARTEPMAPAGEA